MFTKTIITGKFTFTITITTIAWGREDGEVLIMHAMHDNNRSLATHTIRNQDFNYRVVQSKTIKM